MADLVNLAQVVLDVVLAQERDIQPQVFAEARLHALAFGDVLFHTARDHVARGKLFFLRLVIRHEAMTVDVLEQPAVATGALGEQDSRRKGRRRMKLHRLHIAEGRDTGLERNGSGNPFGDHRIGGHAVEPPRAATGNGGGLGNVGQQFAGNKIAHDCAIAATAVVDQSNRLGSFMHRESSAQSPDRSWY